MFQFPQAYYKKLEASALTKENVLGLLEDARAVCLEKMFEHAPIDCRGINKFAEKNLASVSSVADLIQLLSQTKPAALEEGLRAFVLLKPSEGEPLEKKRGDAVSFAFAYWLHLFFKKLFPPKKIVSSKAAGGAGDQAFFAADYAGWRVVKKVDLKKSEAAEVLAFCAAVYSSAGKKFVEFASPQFASFLESFLNKFPERKSFARLPDVLLEANAGEPHLKEFFGEECPARLHAAQQLFYESTCARVGFPPFVSVDAVSDVFPETKIPKPRGRVSKK